MSDEERARNIRREVLNLSAVVGGWNVGILVNEMDRLVTDALNAAREAGYEDAVNDRENAVEENVILRRMTTRLHEQVRILRDSISKTSVGCFGKDRVCCRNCKIILDAAVQKALEAADALEKK